MAPNLIKMGGEFEKRAKLLPDTIHEIPKILKRLDNILKKQKFIVDDEISIVDLIYSQEIDQIRILGYHI